MVLTNRLLNLCFLAGLDRIGVAEGLKVPWCSCARRAVFWSASVCFASAHQGPGMYLDRINGHPPEHLRCRGTGVALCSMFDAT